MFIELEDKIFQEVDMLRQFRELRDELNRLEKTKGNSAKDFQFEPFWNHIKEQFSPRFPDLNNEYKGCVYLIKKIDGCHQQDFLGSGVLVDNQQVLTAHHVVEDCLDDQGDLISGAEIEVVFDRVNMNHQTGQVRSVKAIVENGRSTEGADFIYLELDGALDLYGFELPELIDMDELSDLDELIAVGYGYINPYSTTEYGIRRVSVGKLISEERGQQLNATLWGFNPSWDILTRNDNYHMIADNDSGGPLYVNTPNGLKVIAIHRQIDDNSKVNMHTKIKMT